MNIISIILLIFTSLMYLLFLKECYNSVKSKNWFLFLLITIHIYPILKVIA